MIALLSGAVRRALEMLARPERDARCECGGPTFAIRHAHGRWQRRCERCGAIQ